MKKCIKCDFIGEISLFKPSKNICLSCNKKYYEEYYKKNKEKILEQDKLKEKTPEYLEKRSLIMKKYYERNKESIKKRQREYSEENKHIAENYRLVNKEKIKEKSKIYYQKNKTKINKQKTDYSNYKNNTDPFYKLKKNIRCLISITFKSKTYKKNTKSKNILGCTFNEFKLYIESKFEPWMTWENQGNPKDGILELNKTWDLDHIIPISSATSEEELIKLNHYTNFQPLCSYTNRIIKKAS